jgi:hypothetical protein
MPCPTRLGLPQRGQMSITLLAESGAGLVIRPVCEAGVERVVRLGL